MLKNYIKIAIRNIVRHKVYSIINIMGLAIGMSCAILLLLFVRDELSYDRHNSKYERIYMAQSHYRTMDKDNYSLSSPLPLGPALKDEYAVIEESVRTFMSGRIYFINQQGEMLGENNICYADPGIFSVFDHKFIYGSPENALDAPNTIVLSETLAKKYFGEQNPVGKIISTKEGIDYIVTGVFKDLPHNSFLRYTALITMENISEALGAFSIAASTRAFFLSAGVTYTYILIEDNAEVANIIEDYDRFRDKYIAPSRMSSNDDFEPVYQPLADVYLYSKTWPNSPINVLQRVYILTALALFILIIACINYMNLATARSTGRAREVGVRKVLGAGRASLIGQFLCESIIITLTAMLIALGLIGLLLSDFNNFVGKELSFGAVGGIDLFSGIIIVTLVVGLIAGSYPAFFLSSFLPADVFMGGSKSGSDRGMLRKILVIIQYFISILMIICTMLSTKQMNYVRDIELGFNKDNVFFIRLGTRETPKSIPAFKDALLKYSDISAVAMSDRTAGMNNQLTSLRIEDSSGQLIDKMVVSLTVDFDFIDLMEMEVLEGRSFNREMGTDQTEAVIVNETFIKEMGWTGSPIGKRVVWGLEMFDGKVIGVLKDFHFQSLHEEVEPTVIMLREEEFLNIVNIKISPTNSVKTIEFIKDKWLEMNPTQPIELSSLEDTINNQYRTEKMLALIFVSSAFLGIFISCLGLFGLSSFIMENKTKEIGVRKVFGASVGSIVSRLSLNFLALVIIASIIACPIAYYAMGKWLENFAYKTEMSWWLFVLSACIAMAIALATVSYHTVKAALTDPIKALRYE